MTQSLPRVLLVDDEADNLKALERTLRDKFDLVFAATPQQALEHLQDATISVIVSDQRMPGMLGTELLAQVAKLRPWVARIVLTAHTETKEILDAVNRAEVFRYVTKPWDNQELVQIVQQGAENARLLTHNAELLDALKVKELQLTALNQKLESEVLKRTQELRVANEKLSELAMTDPLTKVLNRRAFSKRMAEELDRSKRYKHPLIVAMIDVDHFKSFNDMEGHMFGDEALKKIAQLLTSNLRKSDTLARYGGEEFIIMMPETRIAAGAEICERLRVSVEATQFQGQHEHAYLTLSIGLCEFPESGDTPDLLIGTADKALYEAKHGGRNRVMTTSHGKTSLFHRK